MHSREVWCPVFNMWNYIKAKFISRTTWLSEHQTKFGTSISVHVWYMTCTYSRNVCFWICIIFNNTCMHMCIVEARGKHFNFWDSVSHWSWSWLIWIACWPVSTKGAGKPIFVPPVVKSQVHESQFLCGCWGFEIRSSCIHCRHFNNWAILKTQEYQHKCDNLHDNL